MEKFYSMLVYLTLTLMMLLTISATSQEAEYTGNISRVHIHNKGVGGGHFDARDALVEVVQKLGQMHGFEVTVSEDENIINTQELESISLLLWNNNDGGSRSIANAARQADFEQFVRQGGGFMACHAGGAFTQDWPFLDQIIVQRYWHHNGANTPATVLLDPQAMENPATEKILSTVTDAGFPPEVELRDEWYSFEQNPRDDEDVIVFLTLDEANSPEVNTNMGSDHPISWGKRVDEGYSVFTSFGHGRDMYTQQENWGEAIFWGMMQWAAGDFEPLAGCMDENYDEYNPDAAIDDPSMCLTKLGCMDEQFEEYDPEAGIQPDGACVTLDVIGGIASQHHQIQVGARGIEIGYRGAYTLSIHKMDGASVWEHNSAGPEFFGNPVQEPGIYHVTVKTGRGTFHKRILIQ